MYFVKSTWHYVLLEFLEVNIMRITSDYVCV